MKKDPHLRVYRLKVETKPISKGIPLKSKKHTISKGIPIGSRREFEAKFDNLSVWNCGPRLFGVFPNK